jgi:hypothetical protein
MAFNFPDGASSGQTHTASNGTVYRYNGTTWIVDSAATTTTFDSKYLNTTGDGVVSGSVLRNLDGTGVLSGSIVSQLPNGVISGSTQITDGSGILSGSVAAQLPSGTISGSTQIASLGYVSSSTVDTIQVMTTASYQAITPVSGTLYIIQG